jgi:hypothetical protein
MWDLLEQFWDAQELYRKHGLKGCVLYVLAIVLLLGAIIAIAWFVQR